MVAGFRKFFQLEAKKEKFGVSLGPKVEKHIMNFHNMYIYQLLMKDITNHECERDLKCIYFMIKHT